MWLPWDDSSDTRLIRLFFFGGSWGPDVVGVTTSVWFSRGGPTPKDCCSIGRGLCNGETTNTLGGLLRMVRSSVVVVGGSGTGLRAGEGGAFDLYDG